MAELDETSADDSADDSGSSWGDALSGFGDFLSGASNLAAQAKAAASSVGAMFNPSTGVVQPTNNYPVQNASIPQQPTQTFKNTFAGNPILNWMKDHPVLTGLGVAGGVTGLFFGLRALFKK